MLGTYFGMQESWGGGLMVADDDFVVGDWGLGPDVRLPWYGRYVPVVEVLLIRLRMDKAYFGCAVLIRLITPTQAII